MTVRPKRRRAPHNRALNLPYEDYVKLNGGDFCFMCLKTRKDGDRKFHRDHDHKTGMPRGLLCFRDNAAIRVYITLAWAKRLVEYLERAERIAAQFTNQTINQTEE